MTTIRKGSVRMMPASPRYCDACGAANQTQATRCWACGQRFAASTEHTGSASSLPAEQPAPPPALLVGRYRIIGIIGTGGFGAVYQAQDKRRHDALVAIKSITLRHLSPEQIIEATDTFNREVRLLTGLEHPNLPRIHDHFTDPEHWYLVMDFIQGETLEQYLEHTEGKHLPVAEVLGIGMQLCTVLDYLHTRQPPIIFRDVKPGNIMRTPRGRLYLIDFGIARRFTPGKARDTMPLGSPGYAAPEQYGTAQTTAQSDIYGLGATLQTLLTGKEPLELRAGYGPASPQGQAVPVALELLLEEMLDANMSKRPQSMEVAKHVLQRIQDEQLPGRSGQPVRPSQQPAPPAGPARNTAKAAQPVWDKDAPRKWIPRAHSWGVRKNPHYQREKALWSMQFDPLASSQMQPRIRRTRRMVLLIIWAVIVLVIVIGVLIWLRSMM
jgi:eukaryotic-like serine/threonine-protein kinase